MSLSFLRTPPAIRDRFKLPATPAGFAGVVVKRVDENDRAEQRAARGEHLWGGGSFVGAGGAGNFTKWQLRNPTGSNVVAVLTDVFADLAFQVRMGTEVTAGWTATAFDITATDSRFGNNKLEALLGLIRNNEAVTSGVFVDTVNNSPNIWKPDRKVILFPGFSAFVVSINVNVGGSVTFGGYLRPIRPEELILSLAQ